MNILIPSISADLLIAPTPARIFVYFRTMLVALVVCLTAAKASTDSAAQTCDQIAFRVAAESGVPVSVLQAITRTETGRRRGGTTQPWPWTVNMEGAGRWFDNRAAAQAYVDENFARGARSFDVGCFQINYRWHGQHFDSLEAMFDPLINGRYAARYLGELYAEKGDWEDAAGAYHSRTPRYANRYKRRFRSFRTALLGNDTPGAELRHVAQTPAASAAENNSAETEPTTPQVVVRINRYPLLQTSNAATRSAGSLVALGGRNGQFSLIAAAEN